MKLHNVENPQALLQVIDKCQGTVELVTPDGDRLNLKSKLCQYISMASIFSNDSMIKEIEIVAHEPEDVKMLIDFMVRG